MTEESNQGKSHRSVGRNVTFAPEQYKATFGIGVIFNRSISNNDEVNDFKKREASINNSLTTLTKIS